MNEGMKVVFRLAIGLFKLHERYLLECSSLSSIYSYLKNIQFHTQSIGPHITDLLIKVNIICTKDNILSLIFSLMFQISFHDIKNFKKNRILSKRCKYLAIIQNNLQESLEKRRRQQVSKVHTIQ